MSNKTFIEFIETFRLMVIISLWDRPMKLKAFYARCTTGVVGRLSTVGRGHTTLRNYHRR